MCRCVVAAAACNLLRLVVEQVLVPVLLLCHRGKHTIPTCRLVTAALYALHSALQEMPDEVPPGATPRCISRTPISSWFAPVACLLACIVQEMPDEVPPGATPRCISCTPITPSFAHVDMSRTFCFA
jgi:hypothetical protein